jgi:hypothetical protein
VDNDPEFANDPDFDESAAEDSDEPDELNVER